MVVSDLLLFENFSVFVCCNNHDTLSFLMGCNYVN